MRQLQNARNLQEYADSMYCFVNLYWNFQEGAGTLETLIDMQCMWFELECALSYYRQGKLGEALKKCHQVEKVWWKKLCVVVILVNTVIVQM